MATYFKGVDKMPLQFRVEMLIILRLLDLKASICVAHYIIKSEPYVPFRHIYNKGLAGKLINITTLKQDTCT